MTQSDKSLIERYCRKIQHKPVEHGFIIKDGKVTKLKGTKLSIDIKHIPDEEFKDCHFIHNHPTSENNINCFSLPFLSEGDINTAISLEMKSITSVDSKGFVNTIFPNKKCKKIYGVFEKLDNKRKILNESFLRFSYYEKEIIKEHKILLRKFTKDNKLEFHIWRIK